ncbi:MAG: D-alanine--D-alanine ligase [Candidatus Accumulibacter sp.]|jgi:D-alanine-D-alanine ligase|nr:D-alanine--D-alanine ligase [Accumulibacter sp.]
MPDFGKVAVLLGGDSAEREVSLQSGEGVLNALRGQGVDAHPFDPAREPLSALRGFDRAFIALHGRLGEDGTIQGALEMMGIPYTGPGVMACALAMDKWRTKLVWQAAGLPVPDYALLSNEMSDADFAAVEQRLGFPIFVKPAREGSSIGIIRATAAGQLKDAFAQAAGHDSLVLAEKGLTGGEYTVTVLGGPRDWTVLPIVKIEPAGGFYDYEAKYLRDDTRFTCPAPLSAAQTAEIQAGALKAYRVLGCTGWSRIDVLMDEAGRHYFLEANTSPGMTGHSLVPMAARADGVSYEALVLKILSLTEKH